MAYQVIARKFRPQEFGELVGQKHVTQTLLNALASDRFPHAILFNGPRGTGKTTSARIIAKTLLCENLNNFEPCQKCQSCLDVTVGRHLDLIEIDGASNNSVDDIRELRDSVGYMPTSGKFKIYIIDEVHMLSTSAFNALLKTLEEPPAHVVFIFATTEIQKIPATILSRCQRFDFRTLALADIQAHLQKICEAEGIQAEDTALWMLAKNAKGSIRDSLTLLDQVISFGDRTVTQQMVMDILGLSDRELLFRCLRAIAQQDKELMLSVTKGVLSTGYDPLLFLQEFLEVLRNALLVRLEAHRVSPLEIPESEVNELAEIVQTLQEPEIQLIFDVTLSGSQQVSLSKDAGIAFEMLLFKLLFAPRLMTSQEYLAQAQTPVLQTTPKAVASHRQTVISKPVTAPLPPVQTVAPAPAPPTRAEPNADLPWEEFVVEVKKSNGFLGALLEHTCIFKEDTEAITLGLPAKMSFLLTKLQEPKNLERTHKFLLSLKGDNRRVEVELLDKKASEVTLSPKAKEEKARHEKKEMEKLSVESHPLVKATEQIFTGKIVSIQESN